MSISRAVFRWLVLIATTFVVGGFVIVVFPYADSLTVEIGVVTNVAMALGIGGLIGWTRRWRSLPLSVVAGAGMTVLGVDELVFVSPLAPGIVGVLAFDGIAMVVAVIGMSILLGTGAVVGSLSRVLDSRCRCLGRGVTNSAGGLPTRTI